MGNRIDRQQRASAAACARVVLESDFLESRLTLLV